MEEEKKSNNHGGFREGAGRKPKGGVDCAKHMGFRASADVVEILRKVEEIGIDNKTSFIEKAIREKWKRYMNI